MTTAHYWSAIVRKIRRQAGLSQSGLADLLGTDQPTVSRWERRLFVPSLAFQILIESRARDLGIATLQDVAAIVTHSPFPMILVSKSMMVIAASVSSGFSVGLTTLEQTPEDEQSFLRTFSEDVAASGFWEQRVDKLDYEFCLGDERRKAVLVPVVMQGDVFALVQKA
ncbi:MAG: Antitoxin component of bacterial toxin-antitoxin system, MqsA [Pseudomonadota bacterium]